MSRKQNQRMNIVEFVKIVNKVVENLTRERWIPIDFVTSWNYFEKFGYKIKGMGYVESDKFNPAYLIGSFYLKPGWSYLSQMRLMWSMDSY